jgi:TonB-linked SusC/RagA family outer membrane protein
MASTPIRWCSVPSLLALLCSGGSLLAQSPRAIAVEHLQPLSLRVAAPLDGVRAAVSTVTLRLHDAPLEMALDAIARQTGLELTYSAESLPAGKRVTMDAKGVDAYDALAQVLDGTGLVAVPSSAGRLALARTGEPWSSSATSEVVAGTLTGQVTDARTGESISGAQVAVLGTPSTTLTAADGSFTLTGVPDGAQRVRVSRIGFAPAEVGVTVSSGQSTSLTVRLEPQALQLEGVVAVGYGTQRKSDITGAIGSVTAEQLDKAPLPTVSQALQGRVAGVQVTQNSAAPGGGFSVRIRGSGSLSSDNEPLFVLDGVPVSKSDGDAIGGGAIQGRQLPGELSFLNPSDIESIEVLKDASATAIYGARGSNGVVLITTKSGRAGKTVMEVESSFGLQQAAKTYDLLDTPQFVAFANELYQLKGVPQAPFPNPGAVTVGMDWQREIMRSAPVMQHNVSLRGGVGATRFALSGGYTDEQGIIRSTGFERYNFRASVDHALSDRFKVGSSVTAARTNTQFGAAADGYAENYASAMQAALVTWPFLPARGDDGQYLYMDLNTPDSFRTVGWNAGRGYENPIAAIREVTDEMTQDRMLGNVFAELSLLDGLSLRLSGGADVLRSDRNSYYTRNLRVGKNSNGIAQTGTVDASNYVGESILRYQKHFGDHGLDLTSGVTYEKAESFGRAMENQNFVTDHLSYYGLDDGVALGGPVVGVNSSGSTLESYIGRANYDYAGRYLLTLTGRYDGSSKFGANHKWGFFPSAAVGWRVSEEPFLSNVGWLSDLKLRVSYGVTGNQEIGDYRSLSRLEAGEYTLGEVRTPGFFPGAIANSDLRWERSRTLDAGFDAALLDNRVSVVLDLYRRTTDDLLFNMPLPVESGFESVLSNVGSVENRGVEFSLGADLIDGETFGWNVSGNVSANRNKVLRIDGATDEFFGGQLTSAGTFAGDKSGNLVRVGEPIGVFYGYPTAGVFRDQAEVDGYLNAQGLPIMPGALPGQVRYVDTDGDGVITPDDRTILGNPDPDLIFGFTNDLRYRRLSLHSFFQGTLGNQVYNLMLQEIAQDEPSLGSNVFAPRYQDRWTPEHTDAHWPRLAVPDGQGYHGAGDLRSFYIEDGSYLRLQSLVLTYDIPETLARRVLPGARSAQFYLNGQNLFTWSNYTGINPDVNSKGGSNINRGIDFGAYPLARSYRLGVRLGL